MPTLDSSANISGFRRETAIIGRVRVNYWIGGNLHGTPVLLWHGFLGPAYSWYKVMRLLAELGFSVMASDMRGYGDSDKPSGTAGHDARALAEEFCALVKQVEFGQARKLFLAGHDMGAHPALLWAGRTVIRRRPSSSRSIEITVGDHDRDGPEIHVSPLTARQ